MWGEVLFILEGVREKVGSFEPPNPTPGYGPDFYMFSSASVVGFTFLNAVNRVDRVYGETDSPEFLLNTFNNNNNIYDLYSAIYLASLAIHRR